MRSSKVLKSVVFGVCCIVLSAVLDFLLEQYNIARVNVHRIGEKRYDDIFIGTSHGLSAINPEVVDKVTGRKSTNLCMPDEYLIDSYFLIKEACRNQKPKRVIYELDPSYWCTKQNKGSNSVYIYKEFPKSLVKAEYFMSKIKEMDIRVALTPWFYYRNCVSKIKDTVQLKLSDAYKNYEVAPLNSGAQVYTEEGYMYQAVTPGSDRGSQEIVLWEEEDVQDTKKRFFRKLVKLCKEEGIELVVITTPVPRETLEKYREVFEESNRYYMKKMEKYDVPYYDYNFMNLEGIDKSVNNYVDYEGHMSGDLGNQFSERLGKDLSQREE